MNERGQQQPVRWRLEPVARAVNTTAGSGVDALQQELAQRLALGVVEFDWLFTLAAPQDDENNPAVSWPADRETLNAGRLVITGWQPQLEGACHAINYDPLVLPHGVRATADPILNARSAAYAESYRRRAWEQWRGAFDDVEGEQP